MSPNLQTSPSSPRRGFFKCGFSGYSRPTTTPSRLDLRVDIEAWLPRVPVQVAIAAHASFSPARSGSPEPGLVKARAGTRDSRHDEPRAPTPVDSNSGGEEDTLPSYRDALAAEPPAYTPVSDEPTLAMYLFKFGFLFPLFWVAGACILLSPLAMPNDDDGDNDNDNGSDAESGLRSSRYKWAGAGKSAHERAELLASLRRTECCWATRCLAALCVLAFAVALAIALGVMLVRRH